MNYTERSTDTRTVRVREVSESIQYGHTASAVVRKQGPRFLRITDIQEGKVDWESVPSCDIVAEDVPKYRLSKGDLVFARTGATTGKSFLIRDCPEAVFASYLIRVRASEDVDPRYLALFFQSPDYWEQIERGKRGIGQPNVNGKVLGEIELPLPPLDEQQQIVAEIEKHFTRLDAGVALLKRVQTALKRYRASILKAACEGRLVPSDKAKWHELTLPDFCSPAANSIRRGPFGSAIKKEFFMPSGYKVYQQQNAIYDDCSLGNYYIGNAKFRELASFEVKPNDLIISCSGTIGKIAIVPSWARAGIINQALLKITLDQGVVLNAFFVIMFRSRVRELLIAAARGAAMQNIAGVAELKKIKWRIPPLAEQQRIVAEVERRFSLVDKLGSTVNLHLRRADRLRRSILQQAFRSGS